MSAPGFTAAELERLRRALPAKAALAPCEPGDASVTFELSVDTITLTARADGRVDWTFERDPIVEWNRDDGTAPDLLSALQAALACG